jgi:nucleoside-diphosphate-sugar epimerase
MCLYLAHQDDLGTLMVRLLEDNAGAPGGPIIAANDQPRSLRQIVELLAEAHGKGKKVVFPIPSLALWAGLRTVEMLGVRMRLRSDSLTSLVNQDAHPDFSATRLTGVPFRVFDVDAITGRPHA